MVSGFYVILSCFFLSSHVLFLETWEQMLEEELGHIFLIKRFIIHLKKKILKVKGLKRRGGEAQEDRAR